MKINKNLLSGMALLLCCLKSYYTFAQSEYQPDSVRIAKMNSPVPYFKLLGVEENNLLMLEPSDFCGKIGIIELWSSKNKTSASVISHYETLQKTFGEKLKIILVTEEPLEDVQSFVRKKHSALSFAIVPEKNMNYLFSHTTMPHSVLVDAEGYIKAMTYPEDITANTIATLLKNQPINLRLKSELLPNQDVLFAGVKAGEPVFKSTLTTYDPDKAINHEWLADNEFVFTNFAIASIYETLYNVTPVRTRIESKKAHWYRTNHNSFICLEMKLPFATKPEMKREAILLLNKALPIKSKMEYRTQKGYSLVKISTNGSDLVNAETEFKSKLIGEHLQTNGFTIRTLREFIQTMEMYELVDAPIVNDTDLSANTPVSIEGLPKTMSELTEALKKYGLGLVEKQFTTDFLILYDDTE